LQVGVKVLIGVGISCQWYVRSASVIFKDLKNLLDIFYDFRALKAAS